MWQCKKTGVYIQVVGTTWDENIPYHRRVGTVHAVSEMLGDVVITVPELFRNFTFIHQYSLGG